MHECNIYDTKIGIYIKLVRVRWQHLSHLTYNFLIINLLARRYFLLQLCIYAPNSYQITNAIENFHVHLTLCVSSPPKLTNKASHVFFSGTFLKETLKLVEKNLWDNPTQFIFTFPIILNLYNKMHNLKTANL